MSSFDLTSQAYSEAQGKDFYRRLMEKLKTSPEVTSAGTAKLVPLSLNRMSLKVMLEGIDPTISYQKAVEFNYVGPGYFPTLGIPVLRGREFTERDDEKAPGVAVVNETAAKLIWNNMDPIGKRFQQVDFQGLTDFFEVVGVVRDSKYRTLGEDPQPFIYFSTVTALRSGARGPSQAERRLASGGGPDSTRSTSVGPELTGRDQVDEGFDRHRVSDASFGRDGSRHPWLDRTRDVERRCLWCHCLHGQPSHS